MADEKIEAGTEIHLVLASRKHIPAKVTKVRPGKKVDLKAELNGEPIVITSAPLDMTGKQPDSWHLPEPEPTAQTPASRTPDILAVQAAGGVPVATAEARTASEASPEPKGS